jgi:hypothetical protein
MPRGKPAGIRCVNLDATGLCRLWGTADYPAVCRAFRPEPAVCGGSAGEAMALLTVLERETAPVRRGGRAGK